MAGILHPDLLSQDTSIVYRTHKGNDRDIFTLLVQLWCKGEPDLWQSTHLHIQYPSHAVHLVEGIDAIIGEQFPARPASQRCQWDAYRDLSRIK
jgi:hypothetical protein